jgi:hypothetical protein
VSAALVFAHLFFSGVEPWLATMIFFTAVTLGLLARPPRTTHLAMAGVIGVPDQLRDGAVRTFLRAGETTTESAKNCEPGVKRRFASDQNTRQVTFLDQRPMTTTKIMRREARRIVTEIGDDH